MMVYGADTPSTGLNVTVPADPVDWKNTSAVMPFVAPEATWLVGVVVDQPAGVEKV
jgi:hypothetical protein